MKKKIIFLTLISSFIILLLNAFSSGTGCCYNSEGCNYGVSNCSGIAGGTFADNDPYCESISDCLLVCCCDAGYSGSDLITTNASCNFYNGSSVLYNLAWSTSDYLLRPSLIYTDENILACTNICNLGLPQCTYTGCEAANTVDCICGAAVANSTNGRFCCLNVGITATIKTACTSSCQATSSIHGYVLDFVTKNPLSDVLLTTAGKTATTNAAGYYEFLNIPSSGSVSATLSNYLSSTISYDISQRSEWNITMYGSDMACVEGETSACTAKIDGCSTQRVCENGVFTECRVIDATCPVIKVCGDGTIDRPNDYDGDGIIDEGTDFYEECDGSLSGCRANATACTNCRCFYPSECPNQVLETDNNEECDPDRSTPSAFAYSLLVQCGKFGINCTENCKCVYGESVCGDRNITYNEDCEWTDATNTTTTPGSYCEASDCGKPGTPLECRCYYQPRCGDGLIAGAENCEIGVNTCPNGDSCVNCRCSGTCTDPPDLLPLEYSPPTVTLKWTHTCLDDLYKYIIHRCQADNSNECLSNTEQLFEAAAGTNSITTTLPTDDNNYCYWIEAVYNLEQGPYISSNYVKRCLNSGISFCEGDTTTQFCQDNKRMQCNNTETVTLEVCNETYEVCVADNGGTNCTFKADCSLCNGLFDMFYLEGFTYNSTGSLVSCEDVDACYLDYTNTTVNKYYSCSDVTSCYTYRSEAACNVDKCGIENCEWAPSPEYSELGLGVCRSTVEELQQCELCQNPDNFIFGDCTKEYCKLYGDCYFDEEDNYNNMGSVFGCMNKDAVSCDYYDTQEECVMSTGTVARESNTNVTWESSYSIKLDGNNYITSRSDDNLSLGLCKWIVINGEIESCAKDADSNIVNNTYIDGSGSNVGRAFDCKTNDITCQRDNKAPNTTLLYYGALPKNLELDYVVYDTSYNKQNINMWFCVAGLGEECYPNKATRYTNFKIMEEHDSGIYNLYYFSEDKSHNIEPLKKIIITVEGELPLILLDYSLISAEIDPVNYPGLFLTNLSVSFNITNKNATCNATLIADGEKVRVSSDLNEVYGDKFNLRYNYLEDNDYTLVVVCKDAAGNINVPTNYGILVDADKSITNPQPSITFNSGENINISVETNRSAVCKYDYTSTDYNEMAGTFSTADGKHHSDVIDVTGIGIIIINVKCNFTDPGKVYGNSADRIKFAIDKTPPDTLIVDGFNQTTNISGWRRFVNFSLLCQDPPIYENNNPYLKNWAFGCGNVYYDSSGGLPQNTFTDRYDIYISTPNKYVISYKSVDKGDNAETTKYKEILIDNVEYGFDITVKDLYTGEIVTIVRADRTYQVDVVSDKTAGYDPDYKITINSLIFRLRNQHVIVYPATDHTPWTGYFMIDGALFKNIENETAVFSIDAIDSHNIDSTTINSGKIFYVDTKVPQQPKFDPTLGSYASLGYPLHKYNSTYYTNDMFLFVTANYSERKALLEFTLEKSGLPMPLYNSFYYDQNENGNLLTTQILNESAEKSATEVYISGDAGPLFIAGNYIEFAGYPREEYGYYKELYEIKEVEKILSGSEVVSTRLEISPALEKAVPQGTSVRVYDGKYPAYWAGTNLFIEYQGENNLTLKVTDEAGNINREKAVLYLDSIWPAVIESSLYPEEYFSTNNNKTNVSVIIREAGSGLDPTSINFTITALETNATYSSYALEIYNCNYDLSRNENGDYICNKITFVPLVDLENSLYEATIQAYDLAHNLAYRTWYFYIEAGAPNKPEFKLKDALSINPDPDNIWYINKTPEFTLEFSDPEPVTVYYKILYNETGRGDENITICTEADNFFDCSFNDELSEQEYSIEVFAYKTLSDGNISPTGRWTFWFTIDKTKPEFELYYDNITNPNVDIDFYGLVENEAEHNLLGYFIINREIENMLYSYSPGAGRIFTISDDYDWVLDEPVKDFNITIRIMDYAGNADEKEYWLRVDNETPQIYLTEVKAKPIFILRTPSFKAAYITEPDVIMAAEYANVSGTITGGSKGYDTSEFYIVDIEGRYTTLTQSTNIDDLEEVGKMDGIFINNLFKANLLIPGERGEETLNNLNFIVVDYAENLLNTYLGVLKDLKPPQLLNITVS